MPRADYEAVLARATTAEGKLADQAASTMNAEIKRELDAAQDAGKITPATRAYHEEQCRAPAAGALQAVCGSGPGDRRHV